MGSEMKPAKVGPPWPVVKYDADSIKQLRRLYHSSRNRDGKRRRFCAYGRELFNALLTGWRPRKSVAVYCGRDAWEYVDRTRRTWDVLVVPPGDHPKDLFYPVYGINCFIFPTSGISEEEIRTLGIELVCLGAPVAIVLDNQARLGNDMVTIKPAPQ